MTKEYLESILTEYGVAFTDSLADRLLKEFRICDNVEPQGDLISRQAVLNTLESAYKVCNTNSMSDYYDLLNECYEVLPPSQPDIEAIKKEIEEEKDSYPPDTDEYIAVKRVLDIIDKHLQKGAGMTREIYEKASLIDHDISVLNDIKSEQDKKHWVGFRSPNIDLDKIDSFWTSEIIDDFKKFVDDEIEKAEKLLEEL